MVGDRKTVNNNDNVNSNDNNNDNNNNDHKKKKKKNNNNNNSNIAGTAKSCLMNITGARKSKTLSIDFGILLVVSSLSLLPRGMRGVPSPPGRKGSSLSLSPRHSVRRSALLPKTLCNVTARPFVALPKIHYKLPSMQQH